MTKKKIGSPRDNPITRAWVMQALADRKWHTQYELVNLAFKLIRPEVASRRYIRNAQNRSKTFDVDNMNIDDAIARGAKSFVQRALTTLFREGAIEYRGARCSDRRESRLIVWYCWACRKMHTGTRPSDGQCYECPEYCWNCGDELPPDDSNRKIDTQIAIDSPTTAYEALCDKCRVRVKQGELDARSI